MCLALRLLNKAKNKTNKTVDIWTKYWTRQNNGRPGCIMEREEQVLFLTTQSAHPLDSRFHNHGQIYCYFIFINDRVAVGAASEFEQSGWMLAGLYPRDICVCYHLSSSLNDNKHLRYRGAHYTLPGLVINYKSDRRLS